MRYFYCAFILCILYVKVSAKTDKTNLVLHVKNVDTPYVASIIATPMMNTIYYDTIGKNYDSVFITLKEPQLVFFVINNDVSRLVTFWLDDKGKNELFADAKNVRENSIIISKMNAEYEDYKRRNLALYEKNGNMKAIAKRMETITNELLLDSLNQAYMNIRDSILYQHLLKNTTSYFTLWNLHHWLDELNKPNSKSYLNKEVLGKLFRKLPKKMKKYPSYHKCLQMLVYKRNDSEMFINEPMFKIE